MRCNNPTILVMTKMEDNNPIATHISKIEDDILFQLSKLIIDLSRLQLDYNRDDGIVLKAEKMIKTILIIIALYENQDKPIFRALKIKLNRLIATNPSLKGVLIEIENSKCEIANGTIERIRGG